MIWLVLVLGSLGFGWLFGRGDASENFRAAAAQLHPCSLTLLLGVTTGLYRREGVRLRRTYASPTLAYLGKGLLFAALSGVVAQALTPVDWPENTFSACSVAAAAGLSLWIGNLPTRL